MTTPRMFRKLVNPASLFTASTDTVALSPLRTVATVKSRDIGGRETPRTICAQNLPYEPAYSPPSHGSFQIGDPSLVNAAALPRPACQWAKSGSIFLPSIDATSGISIVGLFFFALSTSP